MKADNTEANNTVYQYHSADYSTIFQLSGWLRDAFGNYENGFYFAGTMVFLSGVMLFGIPWLQRKTKETRTEQNNRV